MPIAIKSTVMKYKNSTNGEYVEIDAISDKTTAEQVAEILSAGTTEKSEITTLANTKKNEITALANTNKNDITNLADTKKNEITAKGNETLASIPQDYTSLSNQVNDLSDTVSNNIARLDGTKANSENLYLYKEATPGSIVTVDDAVAEAVKQMRIEIAPVQDLHGQENPWPGGGSDNLLPMPITSGSYDYTTTVTVNDDLSFYITKTNGAGWASFVLADGLLLKAGSYKIIENDDSSQNAQVVIVKADDSSNIANTRYNSAVIFTLEQDTTVKITYGRSATGTNVLTKLMLFADTAKTSADYVPYSNICPINGWTGANVSRTGVNLYNGEKTNGYYINASGVIVADSASAYSDLIDAVPNTEYTFSGICTQGNAGTKRLHAYDADENWISLVAEVKPLTDNSPFSCHGTTPNNCAFIRISYYGNETWGSVWDKNVQVELGSTASTYEAFSGSTAEYEFPQEAGTVYGGTLTVNADGTGTLVVDHASVDLSTLTWTDSSYGQYKRVYSTGIGTLIKKPTSATEVANAWCEQYEVKARTYVTNPGTGIAVETNGTLFVQGSITPEGKFIYELATPQTYTLTAHQVETITGLNHIWADCGDILSFLYAVDRKADQSGTYEDLTAGNSLYLLSDRGETDNEPYSFRKTGGSKNAYGREMLKKVVGGTIAWNQLIKRTDQQTISANANDYVYFTSNDYHINFIKDHKYLFVYTQLTTMASNTRNALMVNDGTAHYQSGETNRNLSAGRYGWVFSATASNPSGAVAIWIHTPNVDVSYKDYQAYDLTQMFGSTIANAIYAMEQATEGSGVAFFRSLFPKNYYAYDAGSLQSVQTSGHELTGFNQWDGSYESGKWLSDTNGTVASQSGYNLTDYIRVIPGMTYYKNSTNSGRTLFYDEDKTVLPGQVWNTIHSGITTFTVPANACYIRFVIADSFVNGFILNFSDPSRNGQYVPYEHYSYPLDPVTLRGIPKWDSTNGLYYDGDEYTPDGTVKRRYGIVDLGTLTWSYNSTSAKFTSSGLSSVAKKPATSSAIPNVMTEQGHEVLSPVAFNTATGYKNITVDESNGNVGIHDPGYTDASTFTSAMSGVYFVYELATPTTESADPYRELQISNRNGTEEFTDRAEEAGSRDVAIPVGTETFYPVDVFALIDALQALINS